MYLLCRDKKYFQIKYGQKKEEDIFTYMRSFLEEGLLNFEQNNGEILTIDSYLTPENGINENCS